MDLPWRYPLLNVRKTNLTSHDSITCPKGSDVGYVATKVWTFTGARQQFCPDALPAATKIIILAWVPVELNPGSLAASPSPLPLSHGSSLDPLLSSTLLCSWDKKKSELCSPKVKRKVTKRPLFRMKNYGTAFGSPRCKDPCAPTFEPCQLATLNQKPCRHQVGHVRYRHCESSFNKKSARRRHKHCALAVVTRSQKFRPAADRLPGWPKFNQLETVTTFTYYRPSLVRIDARNFELSW